MSNKDNVTGSKPKIAGCIYTAPIGTAIPTDATTELAEDFKSLGYVSEDGITESESKDSSNILAFGGDVVLITEGEHSYTVQFALLEYLNIDVQKVRHGDANVSGTLEAGLTIKGNANATENRVYVIDLLLNNAVERIVIPCGKVTETGDCTRNNSDAITTDITITGLPDDKGNKYYDYLKKA